MGKESPKRNLLGVFLVACATLMHELLLLRIFSVTLWYHYAFLAVSVAMYGLTVGTLVVSLLPAHFSAERLQRQLAHYSLSLAVAIVASVFVYLRISVRWESGPGLLWRMVLIYALISIPFILSGVVTTICLTHMRNQIGTVYAANLAGSGLGCVALVGLLKLVDGPTAVIVCALIAGTGHLVFAGFGLGLRYRRMAYLLIIFLGLLCLGQRVSSSGGSGLLKLKWIKGWQEYPALYEAWNSYSRVRVIGDPNTPSPPFGWALSSRAPTFPRLKQLMLIIDAKASTPLTRFDSNTGSLGFLRYDVTNVVHYLRKNADVLVIGVGGGRDILAALVFGQESVTGVELNELILDALSGRFGDFTGNLGKRKGIRLVNAEGRAFLARESSQFDVIQLSLVDTWAANAGAALALTEHSLYTVEGFGAMLARLRKRGVVSVSRIWHTPVAYEMERLAALAGESLREGGYSEPEKHVVIVRYTPRDTSSIAPGAGIGTLLIGKDPFSGYDLQAIESVAEQMDFAVAYEPGGRGSDCEKYRLLIKGLGLGVKTGPYRIDAPRDDNPFFFYVSRIKYLLEPAVWREGPNAQVVPFLVALLAASLLFGGVCLFLPLLARGAGIVSRPASLDLAYFWCLGFGFMMVEISLVQRFSACLGNPVYGLGVVTAGLLISGGIGSHISGKFSRGKAGAVAALSILIPVLLAIGFLVPGYAEKLLAMRMEQKILVVLLSVGAVGFMMGMPLPLALRGVAERYPSMIPWVWGVNGSASIMASSTAVMVSLEAGISRAYWLGTITYLVALLAVWGNRRQSRS